MIDIGSTFCLPSNTWAIVVYSYTSRNHLISEPHSKRSLFFIFKVTKVFHPRVSFLSIHPCQWQIYFLPRTELQLYISLLRSKVLFSVGYELTNSRSELLFLLIQALLWNGAYLCTLLAGTNTHSIDFRKSAGGFIHGFRYTGIKIKWNYKKDVVLFMFYKMCLKSPWELGFQQRLFYVFFAARALHQILEWRNHKVTWPYITVPLTELVNVIIKRINEASVSWWNIPTRSMIIQNLSYVPLFGEVQACILLQTIPNANVFYWNVENAVAPRNRHHQTSLAIGAILDHSEKSAKTRRMLFVVVSHSDQV